MNIFLIFTFLFFIGSMVGWCIELIFRKFFARENIGHKWVNPGFLMGPYLPLYGFGLCILYMLATVEAYIPVQNVVLEKILLFCLMALFMTLIEYIAGLIFVKGMNVKLWDYSNEWLNIDGIICPKYSFFWAILGAVYYVLIHPHILAALAWLSSNLAFSFAIGFYFGIFSVDVVYSLKLLVKIKKFADEYEIVVKYEELKSHIRESKEKSKEKAKFIFAMRSAKPLLEHLEKYREKLLKRS